MEEKVCVVCGAKNSPGQGLEICGKLICNSCEERIVTSAVYDRGYPELISRLKKLWEALPVEA